MKGVVVRDDTGKEVEYAADAVLIDAARSPAYELAEQAGAAVAHEPRGFVVKTEAGRIAEGIYAVGEMTGTPFDASAIEEQSARVAESIRA